MEKNFKFCFYDTETTGKICKNEDFFSGKQPHIVQIAAILCDSTGKELARVNEIVRPNGYTIPLEATKVHKITTERALEEGISLQDALLGLDLLVNKCTHVVAHNESFDYKVIIMNRCRLKHNTEGRANTMKEKVRKCTMKLGTNILKLPATPKMIQYGMGDKFKQPSLQELYTHFFNKPIEGAHDAINDVIACKDIYFKIVEKYKNAQRA